MRTHAGNANAKNTFRETTIASSCGHRLINPRRRGDTWRVETCSTSNPGRRPRATRGACPGSAVQWATRERRDRAGDGYRAPRCPDLWRMAFGGVDRTRIRCGGAVSRWRSTAAASWRLRRPVDPGGRVPFGVRRPEVTARGFFEERDAGMGVLSRWRGVGRCDRDLLPMAPATPCQVHERYGDEVLGGRWEGPTGRCHSSAGARSGARRITGTCGATYGHASLAVNGVALRL